MVVVVVVVIAIVNGDAWPAGRRLPVAGGRATVRGTKPTRATADEIRFWREILPVTAYSPFVTVGIDTISLQKIACLSPPLARQNYYVPPARRVGHSSSSHFSSKQTKNQATMVRNDDMIFSPRRRGVLLFSSLE